MRLLALIEAYTLTGPAKNLLRFCRRARANAAGFDVSLVTFLRTTAKGTPGSNQFIEQARAYGIPVHVIQEQRAFDPRVITALRKLFQEQSPDIIQTHSLKSHFLARMTRPSETPWIAFHHGYTATDLKMHLYNQLDRWSLPGADRVITVCSPFAAMLARSGVKRERIRVLQNSIEWPDDARDEDPASVRRSWHIPEDARVVLTIGRMSKEKAQKHLLSATALLRQSRPDLPVYLLLVGDGPERPNLEQQANQPGLQDRVRFTGHQANPLPFYEAADVFALPSLSEGSPNVLLEAMMAGTPAVASAVGGVPDMLTDRSSGLLVKPGDVAALADAIASLLDDKALAARLVENARADALANHTPEAYCRALLGIYEELLFSKRL